MVHETCTVHGLEITAKSAKKPGVEDLFLWLVIVMFWEQQTTILAFYIDLWGPSIVAATFIRGTHLLFEVFIILQLQMNTSNKDRGNKFKLLSFCSLKSFIIKICYYEKLS